jgi:hypothetical protein
VAVIIAVIVLLAGAGTVTWIVRDRKTEQAALPAVQTRGPAGPSPAASQSPGASVATPGSGPAGAGSGGSPSVQPTPSPESAAVSTPPVAAAKGLVRVSSPVASDPRAPAVLAFVRRYFTAINDHSFERYAKLFSASLRSDESTAAFERDFGSSTDSAATIIKIFTSGTGLTGAQITFTSHQKPSQSATGTESCTDWNITLYLEDSSGHYLISQAPPGYAPTDHAC